jgi:hypothetical protein
MAMGALEPASNFSLYNSFPLQFNKIIWRRRCLDSGRTRSVSLGLAAMGKWADKKLVAGLAAARRVLTVVARLAYANHLLNQLFALSSSGIGFK